MLDYLFGQVTFDFINVIQNTHNIIIQSDMVIYDTAGCWYFFLILVED